MIPNLFLLYVESPAKSVVFYERLFERAPTTNFPTYADFTFENGLVIGLWSSGADSFVSGGQGHRSELAFMSGDDEKVREIFKKWKSMAVEIEQEPVETVFGLTFVALDPDGHRIRVCPENP